MREPWPGAPVVAAEGADARGRAAGLGKTVRIVRMSDSCLPIAMVQSAQSHRPGTKPEIPALMQTVYTVLTLLLVVGATRLAAQLLPLPLPLIQIAAGAQIGRAHV